MLKVKMKKKFKSIKKGFTFITQGDSSERAATFAVFVVQKHQGNNDGADDKCQEAKYALMEG